MTVKCRRCIECVGCSHHWIDNGDFGNEEIPARCEATHLCKHCPALGIECEACQGDGGAADGVNCTACNGEGVLLAPDEIDTWSDEEEVICPWCGYKDESPDYETERIERINCDECKRPFKIHRDYSVEYWTTKIEEPAEQKSLPNR